MTSEIFVVEATILIMLYKGYFITLHSECRVCIAGNTAVVFLRVSYAICEIQFRTMGSRASYICDKRSCTKKEYIPA
jgi:hypothetical protein